MPREPAATEQRAVATINQISVLLDTSPIGPTRADLQLLVSQIRQVINAYREIPSDGHDGKCACHELIVCPDESE